MGNDPALEVVAKERSELTDRVAMAMIRNFAHYDAAPYFRLVGLDDKDFDCRLRELHLGRKGESVFGKGSRRIDVRGGEEFPTEYLDFDFEQFPSVMGTMCYANLHVHAYSEDNPSISPAFPFIVASITLDPAADSVEDIARFASGAPIELLKLDGLNLTPEQQEEFRIVPYWEGPAGMLYNHFKYDKFKKLGVEGLAKAFLYANDQGC
jgi:hypothetical protein